MERGAGIDAGGVVIRQPGDPVRDAGLGAVGEPRRAASVQRHPPDVVLVVEEHAVPVLQPSSGPEGEGRDDVRGRVVFRVGEGGRQIRGEVAPLPGRNLVAPVVGPVVRDQPAAARSGPLVAYPGEEPAPLPAIHVDGPDVVVGTAEHRAEGIGLGYVLQSKVPTAQQCRVRHQVGADGDDPVLVQVPDRQQSAVRVAALRRLLLRDDSDIPAVPDLEPGEVRLVLRSIRAPVFGHTLLVAFRATRIIRGICFPGPKPDGDHGSVLGPLRRPVHDLQGVGDTGGALAQLDHVQSPVEAAPRQHVVGGALARRILARAQGRQIGRIVAPRQPPVAGPGRVHGSQRARAGIVDLHAVAQVGSGRDHHCDPRSGGTPRHLRNVAEAGLGPRGQHHDPQVGPLPRRFLGRISAQRQESSRRVEAPL